MYGNVDYGVDLNLISQQTTPKPSFSPEKDQKELNEKEHKDIKENLDKLSPPVSFMKETMTIGKGTRAYKVSEWTVLQGHGRHDVSDMFKKIVQYSGTDKESWLPGKVRQKIHAGPRAASAGYRTGPSAKPWK